ncbi:hypothetical protein EDD16DRAFT_1498260 [Pisolithus croceorrhizus]|nr:hypothetical protein EDD16DRAFT_1498260 [Pisolithus croceorrhizus]KAI6163632.1 hypothetical protein EDD17DRAFT_1476067 [Pisolithus thermaeus]
MLNFRAPLCRPVISWVTDQTTTQEEDRVYSPLGLSWEHMPALYGEGKNAFSPLQLEIIRTYNDQSDFAWDRAKDA